MDYLTIFLIAVFSYAVLVALTYVSFKIALESARAKKADEIVSAEESDSDESDMNIKKE